MDFSSFEFLSSELLRLNKLTLGQDEEEVPPNVELAQSFESADVMGESRDFITAHILRRKETEQLFRKTCEVGESIENITLHFTVSPEPWEVSIYIYI